MNCKNVSELSKEDLIKIVQEDKRSNRLVNLTIKVIIVGIIAFLTLVATLYMLNSEPGDPNIQFAHVRPVAVCIMTLFLMVLVFGYRGGVHERKLDALIELLRKSNVINS